MKNISIKLLEVGGIDSSITAISKPYRNEKSDKELLRKVSKVLKHESVLEHIVLWWEIDGVSRLELQEHVRHRMSSFTVESTRYVLDKMLSDDILSDTFIEQNYLFPDIDDEFRKDLQEVVSLSIQKMNKWKNKGIGADKYKYFLTENKRTSFVWKVDFRNFLHFLDLRMDKNSHFEIQHVANSMYKNIKEHEFLSVLL